VSGINEYPVTATAVLFCGRCPARWESPVYRVTGWRSYIEAARPAFDAGWRVFVGERTTHTYCPEHGPTVPMRQVHPKAASQPAEPAFDDAEWIGGEPA
jgi:hypothetical protein